MADTAPVRRRLNAKTKPPAAARDAHGDEESRKFWEDFADDLDRHHKKAQKLAEIVRNTVVTKKVAGRTVPNSTQYVQTVTKRSPKPIPGKS